MKRETRDKFASGTDQADLTTGNACWETPPHVFAKLNQDFGPFDLDLTADAGRHLCPLWFGPDSPLGEFDAIAAGKKLIGWRGHGKSGYSNPPYGPFVQRLLDVAKTNALRYEFTSALLLPMRATKAFHSHVLNGASELLFCDKRLTFFENGVPRLNEKQWVDKGRVQADPALFDSIVVIYRPGAQSLRAGAWHVPAHVFPADLERAKLRREQAA